MSTNAPLRKSLRKVPDFVSLSSRELDVVRDQMICRDYEPGDVIWRTKGRLDFIGVIQNGEVIIEYWNDGSIIHATRLQAGEFLRSSNLKSNESHVVVLARAVTSVRLYIVHKQIRELSLSGRLGVEHKLLDHFQFTGQTNRLFIVLVIMLIVIFSRQDLSRLISGALYLMATSSKNQTPLDYQNTIRLLDISESIDHGAVFPNNELGYIWYRQGDLSLAESFFVKTLHVDPLNASALNNLSVVYFLKGEYQQAFLFQKKAAQVAPDNSIIRYNLGVVLMEQGLFVEAMREFKEASRIDPNWDLPFAQIAYIDVKLHNYMAAEKDATVAINLNSTRQSSHLLLAITLYNLGRYEAALKKVEDALEIFPHDPVSRFYRALILANLNDSDSALLELHQLLETMNNPMQIDRINLEINNLSDR